MLNYNGVILDDVFRPLKGHPQANLEQCSTLATNYSYTTTTIIYKEDVRFTTALYIASV